MEKLREKKIRLVKNASHLAAISSLYLAEIESSASQAILHTTTLLLRSVKVLSIILSKSNYVQLQHPRAYTTKRKYTWRPTLDKPSPTACISLSSPSLVTATYRNYSHHNRIIPDVTLCNNPKLKTVSGTIPLPSRHKNNQSVNRLWGGGLLIILQDLYSPPPLPRGASLKKLRVRILAKASFVV
jgi:hypothetical protein